MMWPHQFLVPDALFVIAGGVVVCLLVAAVVIDWLYGVAPDRPGDEPPYPELEDSARGNLVGHSSAR